MTQDRQTHRSLLRLSFKQRSRSSHRLSLADRQLDQPPDHTDQNTQNRGHSTPSASTATRLKVDRLSRSTSQIVKTP